MSRGEKIALVVAGLYILMVGVTHGYNLHLNPQEPGCEMRYSCDDRYAAAGAAGLLWPVWWPSHIVQEVLK